MVNPVRKLSFKSVKMIFTWSQWRCWLSSGVKKIVYSLGKWRAKKINAKIFPLLKKSRTILDIGTGTCNIAELLMKNGKAVTPLDVQNLSFVPGITPVLYNGEKIPFPKDSFDTALLICVLHHTKNHEALLKEAKRTSKRIIVIEDIYRNRVQLVLNNFFDNLLNLEFFGNPYSVRKDKEWKQLFGKLGFEIKNVQYYRSLLVFNHALYELSPLPI